MVTETVLGCGPVLRMQRTSESGIGRTEVASPGIFLRQGLLSLEFIPVWKRHTPVHHSAFPVLCFAAEHTPRCLAPNQTVFVVFTSGPHVRITQWAFCFVCLAADLLMLICRSTLKKFALIRSWAEPKKLGFVNKGAGLCTGKDGVSENLTPPPDPLHNLAVVLKVWCIRIVWAEGKNAKRKNKTKQNKIWDCICYRFCADPLQTQWISEKFWNLDKLPVSVGISAGAKHQDVSTVLIEKQMLACSIGKHHICLHKQFLFVNSARKCSWETQMTWIQMQKENNPLDGMILKIPKRGFSIHIEPLKNQLKILTYF